MAYYSSLRQYLEALDKAGKLITFTSPINKDTQLAPLVRLQFRGLPEEERKGFLFTNVVDSKGKKYDIPVAMGVMAASRQVYAVGQQCRAEEIQEKLAQAYMHPIEPRLVKSGPVQEVVFMGANLLEKGGLSEFPEPISTPGLDAGPIASASMWVTKDPETGIRNVGLYRSHLYAPGRRGIHVHSGGTGQQGKDQDLAVHWQKCRARGIPLQVAIVIGGPPNLNYVGPSALPYGVDEYTLAGAMAGQPVELVKCKTVDLEVPANADVVIEGEMTTEELEMEAPHGESAGYMGMEEMQPYLTVKCITRRKDPIWLTLMSQLGPSESHKMSQMHSPATLYKRLKYDMGLSSVLQVTTPEFSTGARGPLTVIQMKMHSDQKEVWRALEAGARTPVVIAVDDDIDPWHPDQFWWTIATRVSSAEDIKIISSPRRTLGGGYMTEEESIRIKHRQFDPTLELPSSDSFSILMNGTLKVPSSPVALPKKEFMEEALRIWEKEGLPPLKLQVPWYSYDLGYWPEEFAEDAARAVRGEYYQTSEMRAKKRVKVDYPTVKPKGER